MKELRVKMIGGRLPLIYGIRIDLFIRIFRSSVERERTFFPEEKQLSARHFLPISF